MDQPPPRGRDALPVVGAPTAAQKADRKLIERVYGKPHNSKRVLANVQKKVYRSLQNESDDEGPAANPPRLYWIPKMFTAKRSASTRGLPFLHKKPFFVGGNQVPKADPVVYQRCTLCFHHDQRQKDQQKGLTLAKNRPKPIALGSFHVCVTPPLPKSPRRHSPLKSRKPAGPLATKSKTPNPGESKSLLARPEGDGLSVSPTWNFQYFPERLEDLLPRHKSRLSALDSQNQQRLLERDRKSGTQRFAPWTAKKQRFEFAFLEQEGLGLPPTPFRTVEFIWDGKPQAIPPNDSRFTFFRGLEIPEAQESTALNPNAGVSLVPRESKGLSLVNSSRESAVAASRKKTGVKSVAAQTSQLASTSQKGTQMSQARTSQNPGLRVSKEAVDGSAAKKAVPDRQAPQRSSEAPPQSDKERSKLASQAPEGLPSVSGGPSRNILSQTPSQAIELSQPFGGSLHFPNAEESPENSKPPGPGVLSGVPREQSSTVEPKARSSWSKPPQSGTFVREARESVSPIVELHDQDDRPGSASKTQETTDQTLVVPQSRQARDSRGHLGHSGDRGRSNAGESPLGEQRHSSRVPIAFVPRDLSLGTDSVLDRDMFDLQLDTSQNSLCSNPRIKDSGAPLVFASPEDVWPPESLQRADTFGQPRPSTDYSPLGQPENRLSFGGAQPRPAGQPSLRNSHFQKEQEAEGLVLATQQNSVAFFASEAELREAEREVLGLKNAWDGVDSFVGPEETPLESSQPRLDRQITNMDFRETRKNSLGWDFDQSQGGLAQSQDQRKARVSFSPGGQALPFEKPDLGISQSELTLIKTRNSLNVFFAKADFLNDELSNSRQSHEIQISSASKSSKGPQKQARRSASKGPKGTRKPRSSATRDQEGGSGRKVASSVTRKQGRVTEKFV